MNDQAKQLRIDNHYARQLSHSIERNARLVAALRMTLIYIDSRIIEMADARAAQALLGEIDRALRGEMHEERPTDGDVAAATGEG